MPALVLGHAEQERQGANQREADRKTKTGIKAPSIHTIHLSVGVARRSEDEDWITYQGDHEWSIDLVNKEVTTEGLLAELLRYLDKQNARDDVKDWIRPKEDGDWIISHLNPRKNTAPREIARWTDARLLSDIIDQGAYNIKPVGNKKLVTLWLC